MAEYAQTAKRRHSTTAASPRMESRKTRSSAAHAPLRAPDRDALHAALNRAPGAHGVAQLHHAMNQRPHVVQLTQLSGALQRQAGDGQPVQRLELTDEMWTHIARGELRNKTKLVGYHWTGDDEAIAMKNGESQQGPDKRGVYVEGVQTRESYGQGKKAAPIKKANASTFWPNDWTEAEIKDAIRNGGKARNNVSEVGTKATKEEARGMSLFVNPDSVFPVIEETAETQTRGAKKKGGRGNKK